MRCYTYQAGRVTTGIAVTEDAGLGRVVALGEQGRGRIIAKVKLDNRRPPSVVHGRVVDCGVVEFTAGGVRRHALTEAEEEAAPRVLVRVNCEGAYVRGANGRSLAYLGDPAKVTHGTGAYGDAGRLGGWTDALWIMRPGDALWVKPTRSDATVLHAVDVDDLRSMPVEDWLAGVVPLWLDTHDEAAIAAELARAQERGHTRLTAALGGEVARAI